jgi:hypothetical protein
MKQPGHLEEHTRQFNLKQTDMKSTIKPSGAFRALLVAGLLAAPMLASTARAITYTDIQWTPFDILYDAGGNPYALWSDPANWSGGNVPSIADPSTGNPDKLHFNQPPTGGIPCVIDNTNAELGALALGDWGPANGTGTLILTNGASLIAGTVAPGGDWTGIGFPQDTCTLYIGPKCYAAFGGHLWVGNGTNADGTMNSGTVIVDGGTLCVTNGQLGVGWNGTGGTNYLVVSNNATVILRNWDNSTLGKPGNNSWGLLDISTGGTIIISNQNATTFFPGLVTSGQLTAYGGAGIVSWSYDPVANTTTLGSIPPVTDKTPVVSSQPANVVATLGGTATFSVGISNVTCNYQWLFNNKPLTDGNGISGSKTANLTINGVTAANVGIYSAWATNSASADAYVLSSGASLSTEAVSFYPVVTINGIPGNTYEVDWANSLTPPVTWTPLTTVTLTTFTQFVVDSSSPMKNTRFYRVVQH